MRFKYNDGGRKAAGFEGDTRDCVCRAIAIATMQDYAVVYRDLAEMAKMERLSKHKRSKSHPRTGVHKATTRRYMDSVGWVWVPTMKIGQGCKVHLREEELPSGRLVVSVSRHLTAVIDGVIHDTYDPQRLAVDCAEADKADINGTRCVYGYWYAP